MRQDHAGPPVLAGGLAHYFDLEDPSGFARLSEPDTALRPLRGLIVVDEIQRRPNLFPLLHVLADLKLDELHVVYPGEKYYRLTQKVDVVPLEQLVNAD